MTKRFFKDTYNINSYQTNKSFSAMILAAGFGKRMLPLTNKIPKPLIQINNTSLLKNCIDFLSNIGCKKIVINTHYKHNLITDFIVKNYTELENKVLDIINQGKYSSKEKIQYISINDNTINFFNKIRY